MCRMIAYLGNDVMLYDILSKFRHLALEGMKAPGSKLGHTSGWGISARIDSESSIYVRSSKEVSSNRMYQTTVEMIRQISGCQTVMAHLRHASQGAPAVKNSHPFVVDGIVFMHNGNIGDFHEASVWTKRAVGETDSERFFLLLLHLTEGKDLIAALKEVPIKVCDNASSLTFLMDDGRGLYAYRYYTRSPDYYTLYYAKTRGSVVFCSEPFYRGLEWHLIGNKELYCAKYKENSVVVDGPF